MGGYGRAVCGHEDCPLWAAARRADATVRKLERLIDRAYENRREAWMLYQAHLDEMAAAA